MNSQSAVFIGTIPDQLKKTEKTARTAADPTCQFQPFPQPMTNRLKKSTKSGFQPIKQVKALYRSSDTQGQLFGTGPRNHGQIQSAYLSTLTGSDFARGFFVWSRPYCVSEDVISPTLI